MIHYKFTETDEKPKDIKDVNAFLTDTLSYTGNFGYHNIVNTGIYRLMGWAYDFREELNRYIVKSEHYGLFEIYHLNKTALRKQLTGYGKISYIKEI